MTLSKAAGPLVSAILAFNIFGADKAAAQVATYFPVSVAPKPKLNELCLTFIVDFSNSAMPHGVNGQLQGIRAGLLNPRVIKEVAHMQGGMAVNFVAFSTDFKLMSQAVLQTPADVVAFANYVGEMQRPVSGGNSLLKALELAEATHDAYQASGSRCMRTVFDFSGDGADMSNHHGLLQEKVAQLAAKGVTVHGLSFFDVTMGKYRTADSTAWFALDRGKFADIHDYFKRVIVTQPGYDVGPGMHFTIENAMNSSALSDTIVKAITEMMEKKVILEVAGTPSEQAPFVRLAGLLPR